MLFFQTQFSRALSWNTVESVLYQGLFVVHQFALAHRIGTAEYGMIGTFFSLVYFVSALSNFGLDVSLAPFLGHMLSDKRSIRRIFLSQLLLLIAVQCLLLAGGSLCKDRILSCAIPGSLYSILALLVISESVKKTVRTALQLLFFNHLTALIEVVGLACYVAMVWFSYLQGYALTAMVIFVPMLLMSLATVGILLSIVYSYYQQLPEHTAGADPLPIASLLRVRLFSTFYTAGHLMFSANFLIPFCAVRFGFMWAGTLKLMSTVTYTIGVFMHRLFGTTSEAVFSRVKQADSDVRKQAFYTVTHAIHQLVYALILFFGINGTKLLAYAAAPEGHAGSVALLFVALMLSEYLCMAYEKFYLVQERADLLLYVYAPALASLFLLYVCAYTPTTLLLFLLVLRLLTFGLLARGSFYRWHIVPALMPDMRSLLVALAGALLFLCFG
jgi:hypothetical protein